MVRVMMILWTGKSRSRGTGRAMVVQGQGGSIIISVAGGNTSTQVCLTRTQFSSSQLGPIQSIPEGTSAVRSGRGEGDVACKRGVSYWIAVDIPSFTFYSVGDPCLVRAGLGSLTSDDGAIGSTGGNLLDVFASCWTERLDLPCCSLVPFIYFFDFFGVKIEIGLF